MTFSLHWEKSEAELWRSSSFILALIGRQTGNASLNVFFNRRWLYVDATFERFRRVRHLGTVNSLVAIIKIITEILWKLRKNIFITLNVTEFANENETMITWVVHLILTWRKCGCECSSTIPSCIFNVCSCSVFLVQFSSNCCFSAMLVETLEKCRRRWWFVANSPAATLRTLVLHYELPSDTFQNAMAHEIELV